MLLVVTKHRLKHDKANNLNFIIQRSGLLAQTPIQYRPNELRLTKFSPYCHHSLSEPENEASAADGGPSTSEGGVGGTWDPIFSASLSSPEES